MINVDYMPCRFIRSDQYFWIKLCNDHIDQIVQWSFAEPAWLETLQRISEISSIIIPAGKIGSTWERSPSTLPSYVLEYQSSSKYPLESRTHSLYILLVSLRRHSSWPNETDFDFCQKTPPSTPPPPFYHLSHCSLLPPSHRSSKSEYGSI